MCVVGEKYLASMQVHGGEGDLGTGVIVTELNDSTEEVTQERGKSKRRKWREKTVSISDLSLSVKSFRQSDSSVLTRQQSTVGTQMRTASFY